MKLGKVYVDSVVVGPRHREADPEKVKSLAESMSALGLQQPIIAFLDDKDAAFLVAGLHRLEAARSLGWEEIDALFTTGDEIDRELIELTENLHRVDLTKEQRDEHIRRFAELIEARDAREIQIRQTVVPEVGYKKPPRQKKGVAAKVAEQTGLSKRTVERALNPKPKVVRIADEPLNEEEAIERQVAALMSAWNRAGQEARQQFLARIDAPVMDQRFG